MSFIWKIVGEDIDAINIEEKPGSEVPFRTSLGKALI